MTAATGKQRRAPRKSRAEATAADCPAHLHGTADAYRRLKCRCPEAETDYRKFRDRRNARYRLTVEALHEVRMAALDVVWAAWRAEPWLRWRGPDTRVDALTVDFLMAGYRFAGKPPTLREYQVAVWRMTGDGQNRSDLAARLGIGYRTLLRYQDDRKKLRGQRTERRLADVKRRAVRRNGQAPPTT